MEVESAVQSISWT